MAKMIKCPTCGTQIEVPPQAAGQIVKCPGCGKGLKLVAKQKSPAAGGQQAAGSISGSSVSAMTFVGDAPPVDRAGPNLDDLPSLDSNCAVCGRATDPNDLVEDNGRLVCPDCIKGARSSIARPEGGAEMVDFAPATAPVRHGKLIQITPSFIGGSVAALVFVACSIVLHLELVSKPIGTLKPAPKNGTQTALGSGAGVETGTTIDPETGLRVEATPGTTATPAPTTAPSAETPVAVTPPADGAGTAPAPNNGTSTPTSASPTSNPVIALAPTNPDEKSIFTEPGTDGAAPTAATTPTSPAPVEPPPPPPAVPAADPLDRGMERLMVGDYPAALREFEAARKQYVVGQISATAKLTAKQQMTLEGVAAAAIATGDAERASSTLATVASKGRKSRPLALNRAIAALMKRDSTFITIGQSANDLKLYLDSAQDDEYAANLFGTLLARAVSSSPQNAEKVAPFWAYLDTYTDRMAKGVHEGQLKWGVDWLPAEEVKTYRLGRAAVAAGGAGAAGGVLTKAAGELERANAAVVAAELMMKRAVDVQGAQKQLDAAKQRQAAAQKAFDEASAAMKFKRPRWLDKFEAVPPEQMVDPVGPLAH